MIYQVTDDSGFLALVDPDAYKTFVDRDWTLEAIMRHFQREMERRTLLIWGTGREDMWQVHVGDSPSISPFRSARGAINSSLGRLHLTSYEDLTYVATGYGESLPLWHSVENVLKVEPGFYECTVDQVDDPEAEDKDPVFHLQLERVSSPDVEPWRHIPWSEL